MRAAAWTRLREDKISPHPQVAGALWLQVVTGTGLENDPIPMAGVIWSFFCAAAAPAAGEKATQSFSFFLF